jgi:hypothetical protein
MGEKNVTVSGGVTRVAQHLRITPSMVDDFLIDPVMGIYVIMGVKLDIFQAVATRITWWVPNVIDSSGFGTGKSFRAFLVTNLRALIIPNQQIVAYYQTFQAMKDIFWNNYQKFGSNRAPIFAAQLGRLDQEGSDDGKDNTRGAACYKQFFKNESCIFGPAPNWLQGAKGEAGRTFNMALIDEWTKVETMTPKDTKIMGEGGNLLGGIDQQIIGRVRAPSYNQHHMLWGNKLLFTATAESTLHPSYSRVRQFQKEIDAGNPNYAMITSCFKDFSNLPTETNIRIEVDPVTKQRRLKSRVGKPFKEVVPNWNTIKMLKGRSRAHFQREALGLWARDTKGFYAEDDLARCVAAGIAAGTQPECSRSLQTATGAPADVHYFNGIDAAPAQRKGADDGGNVVLRLRPRPGLGRLPTSVSSDWLFEYVWAYRVRGERPKLGEEDSFLFAQRAGDWSGLIHKKHKHFNFDGIMMDSQGGGQMIWPELNKTMQRIDGMQTAVTPIATVDDSSVGNAHFILCLFMREYCELLWPVLSPGVDSLYTAAHNVMRDMVLHAELLFPQPFNERSASETAQWPIEQKWALKMLDETRRQLANIHVATKDNGEWDLTRNGAFRFSAVGKKDMAYAALFALVRALIWLKAGELEFQVGGEEYTGIFVM